MTNFLPEDYKVPQTGNYMKLLDGENTFRILSSAIIGYQYWTQENKPKRSRNPFSILPSDIRYEQDKQTGKMKPTAIKHFWAFVVWNADAKTIQILEITQKSVMNGIKALVDNKKWGDPKTYDISVNRKGSGFDTEYTVMPNPQTPVPQEILETLKAKTINLEALYEGSDPFAETGSGSTPRVNRAEGEATPEEIDEIFDPETGNKATADKFQ